MAQDSWPAPGHNSGALTEAEWERVAVRGTDDGVYGDPNDPALVIPGTGLQVTIKADRSGHIRGYHWHSGATDYTHSVGSNSSGQTRIDRVILRLDRSNWTVRSLVKAGTPGSGAPSLQQDTGSTGYYEIPLAQVTVTNGASAVTVQREELWVGARIRPCTSTTRPLTPKRGEQSFETDSGKWIGWNGTGWVTIYEYSGTVTLTAPNVSWDHYAINSAVKRGGTVTARIAAVRQGSTLTADTTGSQIAIIPVSWLRPVGIFHYFPAVLSHGGVGRLELRTDGSLWLQELSKDVPVNTKLTVSITFVTGEA